MVSTNAILIVALRFVIVPWHLGIDMLKFILMLQESLYSVSGLITGTVSLYKLLWVMGYTVYVNVLSR